MWVKRKEWDELRRRVRDLENSESGQSCRNGDFYDRFERIKGAICLLMRREFPDKWSESSGEEADKVVERWVK